METVQEAEYKHPENVVVTGTISNMYFGHEITGEWTKDHGILYSIQVDGQVKQFESLGHAVVFARENPVRAAQAALETVATAAETPASADSTPDEAAKT